MKRYILILLIIFLLYDHSSSQWLSYDTSINYPLSFSDYYSVSPNYLFSGDTIFVFKELQVTMATASGTKLTDLKTLLPKTAQKQISEQHGFSYCFRSPRLIVRNKEQVFLFTFERHQFRFRKQIKLEHKYGSTIYIKDEVLYFYSIYNHQNADKEFSSGILSYDLSTGKENYHPIPFSCIGLTHLTPNRFIDFSENSYVVADPLRYKLIIYDLNNHASDSILIADSLFKSSSPEHFSEQFDPKKMGTHVVDYLEDMKTYFDTLDRIWQVSLIDERTIFVRLSRNSLPHAKAGQMLFYDHLWLKTPAGWKLSQVKQISDVRTEHILSGTGQLWPYFFPGSTFSCGKGYLNYTVWSSSDLSFPKTVGDLYGFEAKDRRSVNLKLIRFRVR